MATLRQDLLRSTYQDQQLKAILSISTYMKDLDARTSNLSSYVSRNGMTADIDDMFDHLADVIRGTGLRSDASNSKSYEKVIKAVKDSKRDPQSQSSEDRSISEEERKRREKEYDLQKEAAADIAQKVSQIYRSVNSFLNSLGVSMDQLITRSTKLINSSNTMIFQTGYTYATVQNYRDDLRSTVDSLNSRYDRAQFDYNESLDLINTIIYDTGIKDIDFYETYGELFLKTSKSMNIHLGSLAEFSEKFYKRYNFSSMNMEEMLTSIRENTAGTSLTDEQVRDFLMSNQTTLAQYADQIVRTQGGDFNTILTGLNDNFAESLAYLNKLGLDNAQVNAVMDTLMKASTDKSGSEAVELLQVGIQGSDLDRFMSDPLSVVEKYVQGAAKLGGSLASNFGLSSTYANAAGLKNDELYRQLYLTSKYGNFITAEESTESNPEIAEDPLRERYVTIQEHISNKASTIADTLADIQERSGVDFPFLQSILNFLKDIFGTIAGIGFGQFMLQTFLGGSTSGGLLGKLKGLLGTSGESGSLLSGLLSKFGPALGIGAAVAGVALSVCNIEKRVSDQYRQSSINAEETVGEVGETLSLNEGDYGYITPTNNGGVLDYEYTATDVETSSEIPDLSLDDFMDTWYDAYESKTGSIYNPDSLITEDFGGWLGNLAQNLGRYLLGPGWWKDNSNGWDKIPVLSGVAQSFVDAYHEFSGDNRQEQLEVIALSNLDIYSNTVGPTAMKAMLRYWDSIGTLDKLTPVYVIDYDTEVQDLLSQGYIPKKVSEAGVEGKVSFEETGDYSKYLYSYQRGEIPYYEQGTTYVPEDQLAYIHQGEAVIPESQNPFNNPEIWSPEVYVEVTPIVESTPTISDMTDTSTYDQRGFDDIVAVQRESHNREESQLSILIEYTQKIFDFINYWKDDYETREDLRLSRENVKSVGQSPMTSTAFG